ncbi:MULTISPECIES: transcription termination/antitermination protein NusG [Corynebacterium]|uniref:Transcription termination/antitermination protein NusG n=1 Tax=Corynebacterium hadale TaxID=2026255 RepID=A0A269PFX2_9CORY|nr:transcription termination/antitermination protein NusG [Corynebacterium hadale]PAJ71177.1 transcription termination/antitermination protein NusG [Corynebacterium hadale]WKC59212.1 hypothetical protein CHAD_01495 [Corynebacterium hadale]
MAVENNDALNTVEENELEMIDEGAPVTDQTDPEEELAEQQADSAEPEAPSEQEEELEMVDEGAPVTEETDPEAEGAEDVETTEGAESTEGDAEAAAAAALGDNSAAEADSEYRARLRAYVRELKKLPGEWYIIQSYSGYENKVKTNLEMRIQTLEVEDSIYDVVVPIEQVLEKKDDKRKLVKRKLLPGYVLVRMEMNDAAWSVVRETPGVTSFVGNEGNATPVKHRDVAKFLMPKAEPVEGKSVANAEGETVIAMPEEEEKPKVTHDYKVGEAVTILSGAFASVAGTISEIDEETGKIQALVSIFGRETPVELTADQIERIM